MTAAIGLPPERRLFGIGLCILGFVMFSFTDACAKWLVLAGLPSVQVAFVRYAVQLLVVTALFLPAQGGALVRTRKPWLHLARAVALTLSTVLNFIAVLYLPLTVTGAITFTMPLVLCALSVPFLGEQVGWRRWLAIVVGLVGVLIIVQPGTEAFHPATLLSLANAVCTAVFLLLTRKLAATDSGASQQFYAGLFASICLAPFLLGGWVWPSDPATWFAFCAIGVVALLAHQLISAAYRFVPAAVAAPFTYTQIFSMSALSWLVFDQPPDQRIFVGAPIVIASGLYIWLRERQLAKFTLTELGPTER